MIYGETSKVKTKSVIWKIYLGVGLSKMEITFFLYFMPKDVEGNVWNWFWIDYKWVANLTLSQKAWLPKNGFTFEKHNFKGKLN